MKILNELAFINITFLLICTALMVTPISSAAASASQSQTGELSVTNGEVNYYVDQEQSVEMINGDGGLNQAQQNNVKVVDNNEGGVKILTVRMSEVQKVDTSSSDYSKNNIDHIATPKSNEVKTISVSKDGSASIDLSQTQTEMSDRDLNQQQTAFLKVIDTNNRVIGIVHLQQS